MCLPDLSKDVELFLQECDIDDKCSAAWATRHPLDLHGRQRPWRLAPAGTNKYDVFFPVIEIFHDGDDVVRHRHHLADIVDGPI
jgi:hypothetical protein